MSETEIENEIQSKNLDAPRLTPECIDKQIVSAMYHRFPNTTTTVCLLVLKNGYTVVGEAACVSMENFDEELGKKISKDNARSKIWALEGYALRNTLNEIRKAQEPTP